MAGEDRPVADHTRPVRLTALAITAAYIAGVVLAAVPSAGSIAAAVAVATAAWLTNRRRPGLVPAAAVLLGWVGIGAVRLLLAAEPEPSGDGPVLMQLDGRVVGTVATIRVPPSKTLYGVSADRTEFDLLTPAGRVAVAVSGHCPDVVVGTRVRVTGRLVPQKPAGNPGERLRRPRLAEPTARLYASHPKTVVPLASSSGALSRLRQRLQTGIRSQLQSHLPLPAASLGRAVLLGDRHALPDEMTQRFRQTGLAHLLAISGLHVGLIAAVLIGPLRRLPVSSRTRFGLFAIALVGFAVLIQPAISAYRAVACAILLAGGSLLGEGRLRFDQLAAVLLAFLLVDPREAFAPGLQLSFTATAAILLIQRLRLIDRCTPEWLQPSDPALDPWWQPVARSTLRAALWSTLVWASTAPIVAFHFRWLTPLGVLLNIVALPMMAGFIALTLAALIASVWAAPVATPLWWASAVVVDGLQWLLGLAERSPWLWRLDQPPVWWIAGLYALLAASLLQSERLLRWTRRGLAGWLAAVFVAAAIPSPTGPARVVVLEVGHGLSVLIQSGDGRNVLFDAGSLGRVEATVDRVSDALRRLGVRRLDALIVSHADVDHFSAVPGLIEQFPIGRVLVHETFLTADSDPHRRVLDAIDRAGLEVRLASAEMALPLGPLQGTFLHPYLGERFEQDNANSLVLRLDGPGGSVLIPGDLEGEGQEFFILSAPQPVDVLLAPHHGSRHSNTPRLARSLRPRAVVISDSRPAHPEVAAVYADSLLVEQSQAGAVTIDFRDDQPLRITAFRTGQSWTIRPADPGTHSPSEATAAAFP